MASHISGRPDRRSGGSDPRSDRNNMGVASAEDRARPHGNAPAPGVACGRYTRVRGIGLSPAGSDLQRRATPSRAQRGTSPALVRQSTWAQRACPNVERNRAPDSGDSSGRDVISRVDVAGLRGQAALVSYVRATAVVAVVVDVVMIGTRQRNGNRDHERAEEHDESHQGNEDPGDAGHVDSSVTATPGGTARSPQRWAAAPSLPLTSTARETPTNRDPDGPADPTETAVGVDTSQSEAATADDPAGPPERPRTSRGRTRAKGHRRGGTLGRDRRGWRRERCRVWSRSSSPSTRRARPDRGREGVRRSSGAVANALERMVTSRWATRTCRPGCHEGPRLLDEGPLHANSGWLHASPLWC
jgi:hypothetical protein